VVLAAPRADHQVELTALSEGTTMTNLRRLVLTALCATVAAFAIVLPVVEVSNGTWIVDPGATELAMHLR
jgi:hypothetical protein